MKKVILVSFALLIFPLISLKAQTIEECYNFEYSSGTYNSIYTTGTKVSVNSGDDGCYILDLSSQNFNFEYAGHTYNSFAINTNGAIRLGDDYFNSLSNNLDGSYTPVIAPLWDDLKFVNYDSSAQGIFYRIDGSQGNRILTIEWHNVNKYGNDGDTASVSFQLKLYESNGEIEFIYGDMSGAQAWSNASASIGINNKAGSVVTFLSVTPGNPPSASYDNAADNLDGNTIQNIAEGTVYRFTYTTPPTHAVTLVVQDTLGNPIDSASIDINDTTLFTDNNGTAVIGLYTGQYDFSVFHVGYHLYSGTVVVNGNDTTINIELEPAVTYTVTFNVYDNYNNPVDNANISIYVFNLTTNANGIATAQLENGTYSYQVSKLGYQTVSGQVVVDSVDETVNVTMQEDMFGCVSFDLFQDDIGIPNLTFGVALADFNGDGFKDVATVDAYKQIVLHFWDTTTNKMDTTSIRIGQVRWRYDIKAVDIDQDGDMDLITSPMKSDSYGMEVWVNDGSGNFTLKTDQIATHTGGYRFAVGDLNGDGYPDIFFPYNDIAIYLNDGNGNFVSNGQSGFEVSSAQGAALGDFDGDGDLDAVVVRDGGEGFVGKLYINDGTGHFVDSGQELSKGNAESVDVGDIDNDGDLDIVIAPWEGNIYFFMNDGMGTFLPGDTLFENEEFYDDIIVTDLNFDGLPDIVTDNDMWLNSHLNPGHFYLVQQFDGSTNEIDVADVNNDGLPDLYRSRFSDNDGDQLYLYSTPVFVDEYDTICYGDSLQLAGVWRSTEGVYYNYESCGTVARVHLFVLDSINTGISENNGTLTVAQSGAEYQWLTCGNGYSPIDGATLQSFTPDSAGSYAVVVYVGSCSDTSECYQFGQNSADYENMSKLSVYPNPAHNFVKVSGLSAGDIVTINDVNGRVVYEATAAKSYLDINIAGLHAGVYFVKVSNAKDVLIKRVIKN